MIPIGARCILLRAFRRPERAGTTCVVTSHERGLTEDDEPYECLIYHDDPALADDDFPTGEWGTDFRYLLPIGHDPDAETRNVEREVEA